MRSGLGRTTLLATAAAVALVGAACEGNGDGGGLQDDVGEVRQAQQALLERTAEVERRLDEVQAPGGDDALAALQQQLDGVQQTVADVASALDAERTGREDRDASLGAALSDLEDTLVALQAQVTEQRDGLLRLREDYELLLDRFERHVAEEG